MKRAIVLILTVSMILCFAGCGKNKAESNNTTSGNSQAPDTTNGSLETQGATENTEVEITPDNWGVTERWSAWTSTGPAGYYINFPNYSGYKEGWGMVAEQLDGTVAIIMGQHEDCPEVDALEHLFPAYYSELEFTLHAFYGLMSKNFEFSIESDSPVTIGQTDMHMFSGTFKFDDKLQDESYCYQFVLYATQLQKNGAYAYWFVYDITDDQSNGDLVAEHALNMAKTFREAQ